jgi:hypothetical protein
MKRAQEEYIEKAATRDTKDGIQMAIDVHKMMNKP